MLKKSSNVKDKIESVKDFFQIKGAECPILEKELTIAMALAEDKAKREKAYQHQIETLRQEVRQAELKAAVSETKLSELEKQLNRHENSRQPVE